MSVSCVTTLTALLSISSSSRPPLFSMLRRAGVVIVPLKTMQDKLKGRKRVIIALMGVFAGINVSCLNQNMDLRNGLRAR